MQWVLFLSVLTFVCGYLLKATELSFYWCVIDKDNHAIINSEKSLPCEGCRPTAAERNFHRESRDVHPWLSLPVPPHCQVSLWPQRLGKSRFEVDGWVVKNMIWDVFDTGNKGWRQKTSSQRKEVSGDPRQKSLEQQNWLFLILPLWELKRWNGNFPNFLSVAMIKKISWQKVTHLNSQFQATIRHWRRKSRQELGASPSLLRAEKG